MNSFDEIYSLYFTQVYKYILSLCRDETIAEEVTQEAFFKALKNIGQFKGECKLSVWLCQIAKNTYFSMYKKEKKIRKKDMANLEDGHESIIQSLIDVESAIKIHKALHQLKEPYKEVFSLRVFGELSFAIIGEIFEKNENWARVTFFRAKQKIIEEVGE